MARLNIYVPDDLAAEVKAAGLNVSQVAQDALRRRLQVRKTNEWVAAVSALPASDVTVDQVTDAVDEAREEAGRHAEVWLDQNQTTAPRRSSTRRSSSTSSSAERPRRRSASG
jgi:post-segregation antitoxin (ccd killing protein)